MHYIQKYILDTLITSQYLRNRDMRPPHTESNLYQYHLKRLIDSGYVQRDENGYSLSIKGLQYADKHSSNLKDQRPQPKLITTLILENEKGEILLIPRKKQPFIGMYNLPSGKVHEGETLLEAGERELIEKAGITSCVELKPQGSVHLTIVDGPESISESYGFILAGTVHEAPAEGMFVDTTELSQYALMPGVREILDTSDPFLEVTIDAHIVNSEL